MIKGICCAMCKNFETLSCPINDADPWSKYQDFCSEFKSLNNKNLLETIRQQQLSIDASVFEGAGDWVKNNFTYEMCDNVERKMNNLYKDDAVNHPKHYTQHPSGVECIDITRHYCNNIGNVIKYCWRSGLKDGNSDIQDLKKALWYLQDEIKMRENI